VRQMFHLANTIKAFYCLQHLTYCSNWGTNPQVSPSVGDWVPHQINVTLGHNSVPAKWHLIRSNGFSRVTDRQMDMSDTSVAIGRIADVMLHKKSLLVSLYYSKHMGVKPAKNQQKTGIKLTSISVCHACNNVIIFLYVYSFE